MVSYMHAKVTLKMMLGYVCGRLMCSNRNELHDIEERLLDWETSISG